MHEAASAEDYPTVGDYVTAETGVNPEDVAIISGVLPRKSIFLRKAAGTARSMQGGCRQHRYGFHLHVAEQ